MILNSPDTLIKSNFRSCAWTTEHLIIAIFVYSSELFRSLNQASDNSRIEKALRKVLFKFKTWCPRSCSSSKTGNDRTFTYLPSMRCEQKSLPRNSKLDRSNRGPLPTKPPSFTISCKKIISKCLQLLKPEFLQMHPRRSKPT